MLNSGRVFKICIPCDISPFPAGIFLFKINKGNTITMSEICSELTRKTPEWRQWCRSSGFFGNFEQILHCLRVYIVNFEQVNADWVLS